MTWKLGRRVQKTQAGLPWLKISATSNIPYTLELVEKTDIPIALLVQKCSTRASDWWSRYPPKIQQHVLLRCSEDGFLDCICVPVQWRWKQAIFLSPKNHPVFPILLSCENEMIEFPKHYFSPFIYIQLNTFEHLPMHPLSNCNLSQEWQKTFSQSYIK